jgi:hypothetical protein
VRCFHFKRELLEKPLRLSYKMPPTLTQLRVTCDERQELGYMAHSNLDPALIHLSASWLERLTIGPGFSVPSLGKHSFSWLEGKGTRVTSLRCFCPIALTRDEFSAAFPKLEELVCGVNGISRLEGRSLPFLRSLTLAIPLYESKNDWHTAQCYRSLARMLQGGHLSALERIRFAVVEPSEDISPGEYGGHILSPADPILRTEQAVIEIGVYALCEERNIALKIDQSSYDDL